MLTIQPNLVNNYGNVPAFGKRTKDDEYIDYAVVSDSYNKDYFDLDKEEQDAEKELSLWKQTKHNIDTLTQSTESVPALNKGMKIFSGLISVAIGWGGLRWGTAGTLKVLSDIGKTKLAQSVKTSTGSAYTYTKGWLSSGKNYVKNHNWYRSIANALSGAKESFLNTKIGETLTGWKNSVKASSVYNHAVNAKDSTTAYVKKLNPKRIFIETMGVAGGGTALVNVLGGKPVDGVRQNVEKIDDGYTVDEQGDFYDAD